MSESSDTTTVLDLDNSDFVNKVRESLGLMEGFGDIEGLLKLTGQLVALGEMFAPIVIAVMAVKAALDLTTEAEHIEQINRSFQMLASSAGLAGDALKEKLVAAAGGLASETEILQAANKEILAMGENASKLPQIMELARKYTAGFGGDLIQNFEQLSTALERGNPKMLQHFGIVVDINKAHEDYARNLGFGAAMLDQTTQKQAVLNAALAQAEEKYKGIDTSQLKATQSQQTLWAATKELFETWAVGLNKVMHLSEAFSHVIGRMTELVNIWTADVKSVFGLQEDGSKKVVKGKEDELAATKKTDEAEKQQAVSRITNQDKYKTAVTKFNQEILKIAEQRQKDEEKDDVTLSQFKKLRMEEEQNIIKQASEQETKIRQQAAQLGLSHSQQVADAIKNIEKKKTDDIRQLHIKAQQDEVLALKNLQQQNEYTATGFSAAWRKNSAQAKLDLQNFGKLGDMTFKTVGSRAVDAFKAMGKGSQDAGQAIKGFLFGTIGDVAVAQGTEILLSSIWPPNPVGLAAGGALIAFGEALSAVGQGSGGTPSAGGGGGASAASAPPSAAAQSTAPTPVASQSKTLSIAFHGDFVDTDASRTKFMDMIRQSGDYTDFNLLKVGQSS